MACGVKSLRHTGHRDGSSRMDGMTGKGRKEDELLRQGLGRVKSEEERWEREDWEADDEEEMSAERVDGMVVVVMVLVMEESHDEIIVARGVTDKAISHVPWTTDGRSNHEPTSNKMCVEITCKLVTFIRTRHPNPPVSTTIYINFSNPPSNPS